MNSRELIKLAAARIAMHKIAEIIPMYGPQDVRAVGYEAPSIPAGPQVIGPSGNMHDITGQAPTGARPGAQQVGAGVSAAGDTGGNWWDSLTKPNGDFNLMGLLNGLFKGNNMNIGGPALFGLGAPMIAAMLRQTFRPIDSARHIRDTANRMDTMSNTMRNRMPLEWREE